MNTVGTQRRFLMSPAYIPPRAAARRVHFHGPERMWPAREFNWRVIRSVQYARAFLGVDERRMTSVCVDEEGSRLEVMLRGEAPVVHLQYPIPVVDAAEMLQRSDGPRIDRLNRRFRYEERAWSIDEYLGENEGLVTAMVELDSRSDAFEPPFWVGKEITGEDDYDEQHLLARPWATRRHTVLQGSPLRPCPHCGNVESLEVTDTHRQHLLDPRVWVFSFVHCRAVAGYYGCGASGGWADDAMEAIELWNRRVERRVFTQGAGEDRRASSTGGTMVARQARPIQPDHRD